MIGNTSRKLTLIGKIITFRAPTVTYWGFFGNGARNFG